MDHLFFHNFFTVSGLNYVIFTLFSAGYLMTLRNRTIATRDLIFLFTISSLMALAYFLAYLIPRPVFAYHRWISVGLSLYGTSHVVLFFLHYPEPIWPRFRKVYFWSTFAVSSTVTLVFVYQSLSAPKVYEFDGHYFDVDLPVLGRIVGAVILLYVLFFVIAGIIRIVKEKKRFPLVILLLAFLLIIFVPGVFNMLNRLSLVDREIFQTIWNMSVVAGAFVCLVIYVNHMTERTTLLMKLYAISLVTVLLILQAVNFHLLRDRESLYDAIQIQKGYRAIVDPTYRSEDLSCVAKVNTDGTSSVVYEAAAHPGLCRQSSVQQAVEQVIHRYLNGETVSEIKSTAHASLLPALAGTLNWLEMEKQRHAEMGMDESMHRQQILKDLKKGRSRIRRIRGIIERLPGNELRAEFEKAVQALKSDPFLAPRLEAAFTGPVDFFQTRNSLLELFAEPLLIEDRGYGIDRKEKTEDHPAHNRAFIDNPLKGKFITYYLVSGNQLYQVDFRYEDYRTFLNEGSFVMNNLQIGVTVLIMLGYPIFFLGALLRPLRLLLGGVETVNRGDLNVQVPVKIEDEIGFLTRNFNSMVDSIRTARQELREYADQLEQRVIERTEELQNTLVEVRSLKEVQDGDYFLTSLLQRPLSANHVPEDGPCNVSFIVKQKKQFTFRRWKSEIGGDLCTAHRIMLRGRPFIFAVNADAMGKSIQGAGGALVLGAVLESLVERTKYSEQDRELLPEKWLKLAFIECHRVFESFDGSMLVSLIMSLIDEETGFTYFINAEHPLPVLIRNGQASFVEQGTVLRKLGMTGMSGFISIQTLSLEPGDVLIFGSDGKDDLILGEKDGMRLINEDERLFLKIAEEAQGDPSRMTEILSSRYELMDDLSLLSIQYRPDSENLRRRRAISRQLKEDIEAVRSGAIEPQRGIQLLLKGLSEYPENIHLHKQLASLYLKIGQYGRAIIHMEKYLRFRPEDDEMLFRLFLLMKKRNLLARAAEYGEVYHLRHPDDPRVVRELVEVYARLNNKVREEKFLRRLEAMQMMQDST